MLAKLVKAHAEAVHSVIKWIQARKHDVDVNDEQLIKMLAGGV
jgi:hypothetical protein